MEQNELRVGNYVFVGNKITKVELVGKLNGGHCGINHDVSEGYYEIECGGYFNNYDNIHTIHGIPINRQWLIDLQFQQQEYSEHKFKKTNRRILYRRNSSY